MKRFLSLIALFILLSSLLNVNGIFSPKLDSNDIAVTVNFGYGRNIAVQGKWIPVTITLENKTNDTIEGDIVLTFLGSTTKTSVPFVLPGKVEKKTTMYVFYYGDTRYKVSLLSKSGKVMYETGNKTLPNDISYDIGRINMIGILTDNTDSLNYILQLENLLMEDYPTQVGGSANNSKIRVDAVTSTNFPVSKDAMSSFDALIINDFDLSSLTNEQKAMFDYYIQTGGTVIFGTGNSASYAFAGMDKYVKPTVKNVQQMQLLLNSKNGSKEVRVNVAEIEDENLSPVVDLLSTDIVYKHDKYNLYYFAFGLNEKDFTEWAGNYRYIFEFLTGYTNTVKATDNYSYDNSQIGNILSFASKNFTPSMLLIVLIVFIYLIVLGPVSYAILKKKDKREYMWIAIPVIVIVFSVTIFMYGFVARGGGNSASTLTIVELNPYSELQKPAHVTVSVMTSSSGEYKLSLGNDALFGYSIFSGGFGNMYSSEDSTLQLSFNQGSKSSATIKGATMWSFLDAEATMEVKNYGSISSEITIDENNNFKVKLKNNTGYDLENVVITVLDDVRTMKEFKYLDTVELSFKVNPKLGSSYRGFVSSELDQMFNRQNSYYYGNYYNMSVSSLISDMGKEKALQYAVLNEFLMSRGGADEFSYTPRLHIAGFVKNAEPTEVVVNGRKPTKTWDRTLVHQSIDIGINIQKDDKDYKYIPELLQDYSSSFTVEDDIVILNEKGQLVYEVTVPIEYVKDHQISLLVRTKDNIPVKIINTDNGINYGKEIGSDDPVPINLLPWSEFSLMDPYMEYNYGKYAYLYFVIEPYGEESVVIEEITYKFILNDKK